MQRAQLSSAHDTWHFCCFMTTCVCSVSTVLHEGFSRVGQWTEGPAGAVRPLTDDCDGSSASCAVLPRAGHCGVVGVSAEIIAYNAHLTDSLWLEFRGVEIAAHALCPTEDMPKLRAAKNRPYSVGLKKNRLFTMRAVASFRPLCIRDIVNGRMPEVARAPGIRQLAVGTSMDPVPGLRAGVTLVARFLALSGYCMLVAQCSQAPSGRFDPKYGVSASPRLVSLGEPVPKGGGVYRVGKAYSVAGQTYSPEDNPHYSAEGLASWYGEDFHGRATANGEIFDMTSISAAHPTLPIPSYVRVTNLANRKSIIVRVNDRGPYHQGRLIDVSVRTAKLLGFYDAGVSKVRVDYVGRAALEGSDDNKLAATLANRHSGVGPGRIPTSSIWDPPCRNLLPLCRDPLPLPADRPFELGHDEAASRIAKHSVHRDCVNQPAANRTSGRSAGFTEVARGQASSAGNTALHRRLLNRTDGSGALLPASCQSTNLPAAPTGSSPVSAYAAPAPVSGAVVSGRGLY